MRCLEILHTQRAKVSLGRENGGVPQDPSQEFQVAAPPEVLTSECVPTGVGGDSDPRQPQVLSKRLEAVQEIPDSDSGLGPGWKHEAGSGVALLL